ncbi:lantibiotic biosynthesis dehydratase-like protein [Streptomyces sp. Ag109_G2-6]|uniref:lantibiotic dehydratase n=1 Tax=Streptomyces TaxID=1883 RepID=UPI0009A51978|nr:MULTISPECIES: lantibiotic dehydratase [Streptomyces]RPF25271.1 lantibiotic biosynthesis dehydratase-like protein [Streptomyces sp. Ag109_G2-6]
MQQPHGTPAGTGTDAYRVCSAPYALVRATVLSHPAPTAEAAGFRTRLARLRDLERQLLETAPALCDDLHDSRGGHPDALHRDIVLPLRRALHNGREPRPALLERLGDLPARIPRLAHWLDLRTRRDALLAALAPAAERALTAERGALTALCREPALAKAVALTSADLLRAVERAATGAQDRRARKEEPAVLRYALRASTKTSPLSWFTAVGWGPLPAAPGRTVASWGTALLFEGPLRAAVQPSRTLTTALVLALLDAPHRRAALPHRITSTARLTDGQAAYTRDRTAFAGGRYLVAAQDEARLPYTGPLALVTENAAHPVPLDELTALLAAALTGAAGADGPAAAAGFLGRLAEAGLLVPTAPVPPQDTDPLGRTADWLRSLDGTTAEEAAEDAAHASRLDGLARATADFAGAPAAARPALLTGLSQRWTRALAAAGRPVPAVSAPLSPVSEDVVAPHPLDLDGFLAPTDHEALGEVTALAELFDLGHLLRRVVRDRFVARYGTGGRCPDPWEFGPDIAEAWEAAGGLSALDPADALPSGTGALAHLRAEAVTAVRDALDADPATAPEVLLPPGLLKGLGDRLPAWALARPLSYAYFLQRDPRHGLLCVNQVYGGWGRFTSRFLDTLDPAAAAAVSGQIRRALGPGARAAQIRPVGGFNANLHPLLVPDEIGPDRRWASLGETDLELVHDETDDQVRIRLRDTGELLDVLYPGFLAPVLLPRRLGAHLSDQPHGMVDLGPLVPRGTRHAPGGGRVTHLPRLRHRDLVLRRRRWLLPPGTVERLRADLTADGTVPAQAAARWRAALDLPEQVFLHPAGAAPTGRAAEDFLTGISRPKPHLVDLGNALHLRCLPKWLSRHGGGAVLEEALPAPGGQSAPARAVELVLEVYRTGQGGGPGAAAER